ncbi:MAG TPA: 3-phosphoshikimate 1-carboxyvinyltransferase, partial [Mycobacteriales bacterium]|nr:3-phosphoshikimate 1-carboxyvinyltransferase [Mycobacteriales bacterium]
MTSAPWPAPRAQRPVDAIVPLPGSKSMTNRALVIAALARGRSVVRRPLRSRDTELMAAALRALGVSITEHGETPQSDRGEQSEQWFVSGVGGRPQVHAPSVDVGLAGTVARFLPAVAALADGSVEFDGDAQMRERPMAPLLHALRHLGVRVDAAAGDRLPWRVHGAGGVEGGGMRGGEVTVDASTSSQLVSGLLLAAPCFADGLVARHVGPPMPSRPHVDMTVAMMRSAGGQVEEPDRNTWVVRPGGYRACDVEIEPDLSGASAFLAAAVATGG